MNASQPPVSRTSAIEIAIATGNPGKLIEIRELLGPRFRLYSADDLKATLPEETGTTFSENATLKAVSVSRQSGMPAIADDSGLEVMALNGAPGVYTARFAGDSASDSVNRQKLLDSLCGVEMENRYARFVSVIAVAFSPDDVVTAIGTCDGAIALQERGTNGFGYDSIFELPSGKTLAELSSEEKNALSHRGHAMEEVRRILEDKFSFHSMQDRGTEL